jgi:hypothetical protein
VQAESINPTPCANLWFQLTVELRADACRKLRRYAATMSNAIATLSLLGRIFLAGTLMNQDILGIFIALAIIIALFAAGIAFHYAG